MVHLLDGVAELDPNQIREPGERQVTHLRIQPGEDVLRLDGQGVDDRLTGDDAAGLVDHPALPAPRARPRAPRVPLPQRRWARNLVAGQIDGVAGTGAARTVAVAPGPTGTPDSTVEDVGQALRLEDERMLAPLVLGHGRVRRGYRLLLRRAGNRGRGFPGARSAG